MNESNEAEFGDEPIELVKLSGEDKFDCLISAGYFTCSFQIKVTGSEKHKISLVRSASADDTEDPDYTLLELRHKPDDMGSDTPVARSSMARSNSTPTIAPSLRRKVSKSAIRISTGICVRR